MGAYLSQPKTDKVSTDEFNEVVTVGASSMQGWRNSQEDAHNSILNYDKNTSFFAVYDGHGGAEVATYCADKLPHFLKELPSYKDEKLDTALKEAFLGFDKKLLEPKVVEELKILAGEKNFADGDDSDAHDDDEDVEDLVELHEESNLPLNLVLEKYKGGGLSMPALKRVKDGATGSKPQSPYLRGRRAAAVAADAANKAVMDPDAKPQGSSTSRAAAAAAAVASLDDAGPSSSNAGLATKMDTDEPEEDSTVSSSSSSASKSNSNNNTNSNIETEGIKAEVAESQNITTNGSASSPTSSGAVAATADVVNSVTTPDSSHLKENEQNGSVTSSVSKSKKGDVSTSGGGDADATVSGSNDATKRIQNGTVGSTSSQSLANKSGATEGAAISSTSKEVKKVKKLEAFGDDDSTDDDADYDAENSSVDENDASHVHGYSSDDEEAEDAENSSVEYSTDEELEEEDDVESAMANEQFCANMIEEPGQDSGCTAVVALLRGRDLYVANAGDSRCVVCRNGVAIEMSLDHKPEDQEESTRIIKAGGRVTLDGRVNGGLNLSRAIGDHAYKMNAELPAEEQMISALPDIRKLIIKPEDEFMVLACDGIWNYMTSDEVVQFVRVRLQDESKKMSQICEELFDHCLAPNTMGDGTGCDNMTAVIVRFERKLLDMPTKINPNDVVIDAAAAGVNASPKQPRQSLKRSASPTTDDNSNNEAENANKTKRLKTDGETSSTITTTSTTNTTLTAATATGTSSSSDAASSNSNVTASTTAAEEAAAVSSIIAEQKECDSDSAGASSDAAPVSST